MFVDELLRYLSHPFGEALPKLSKAHRRLFYYLDWLSRRNEFALDEYNALAQRINLIGENLHEMPDALVDPDLRRFFMNINAILAHSERGLWNLGSFLTLLDPEFKKRLEDPKCLADWRALQDAVETFAGFTDLAQDLIRAQPWFHHQTTRKLDYIDLNETIDVLKRRCAAEGKAMSEVAGRDFEYLAGAFFADLGFKVYLTASSKDGGFDLVALQRERDGTFERLLVECKSSPKGRVVGVGVVRALFGVAHAEPSTGGICVSSTYFSREAREFHRASAGRLSLVEGELLKKWLQILEKRTSVTHGHAE